MRVCEYLHTHRRARAKNWHQTFEAEQKGEGGILSSIRLIIKLKLGERTLYQWTRRKSAKVQPYIWKSERWQKSQAGDKGRVLTNDRKMISIIAIVEIKIHRLVKKYHYFAEQLDNRNSTMWLLGTYIYIYILGIYIVWVCVYTHTNIYVWKKMQEHFHWVMVCNLK